MSVPATTIGSMHMRTGKPSGAALARDPNAYDGIPNYEAVPPADVRCFTEYLREAGWHCTNRSKQDYQFTAPVTAGQEVVLTAQRTSSKGRKHTIEVTGLAAGATVFTGTFVTFVLDRHVLDS